MSRIPPLQSECDFNSLTDEIPRHILRQLLQSQKIGLGARLLDVGGSEGSLVDPLTWLGIDVSRCDAAEDAGHFIPRSESESPAVQSAIAVSKTEARDPFDAIVVRNHAHYAGNLFARETLTFTAKLLSGLRPGGVFVYLNRFQFEGEDGRAGHDVACWARHLSCFPGVCRVARLTHGIGRYAPWNLLIRRQSASAWRTISVRIPERPILPSEWQRQADVTAESMNDPCCVEFRDGNGQTSERHVA